MTPSVSERIGAVGVVPVTAFESADRAYRTAAALMRGGVSCIEVTFRTDAAAEAIARVREVEGLLVGAGTLLSVRQVHQAVAAGAQFGVAPGTNPAVIEAAQEAGLPFFPGVATPSEIERVLTMGISIMKVFPAGPIGGPAFLKSVAAVYPDVQFIPTGGISGSTLLEYMSAPGVLAVGGSWIASTALIRDERYDDIERLARGTRKQLS